MNYLGLSKSLIQFNPHHQTDGYCEKADGAFEL
jgi:hypothetical protein